MRRQVREPIFRSATADLSSLFERPEVGRAAQWPPRRWSIVSDRPERTAEVLSRQGNIDNASAAVKEFCLAVPALRVTPTHCELEKLWDRCALFPVPVVASALCDQLGSASVEQVWQPALRALHVIVHFHAKAGMGKTLVNMVLSGAGGEYVKHLAQEVPECQLVARNVLLLRRVGVRNGLPEPEIQIDEVLEVKEPADLIDFVESISTQHSETDGGIPLEGRPCIQSATISEDLILLEDLPATPSTSSAFCCTGSVRSLHNAFSEPRIPSSQIGIAAKAATTRPNLLEAAASCHVPATSSVNSPTTSGIPSECETSGIRKDCKGTVNSAREGAGCAADLCHVLKTCPTPFAKSFDISDGDPGKDNVELSEMFSFRRRDNLIKNFSMLVASTKDTVVEDPFAFVAEHVDSARINLRKV